MSIQSPNLVALNNSSSQELELEWGNWTAICVDKTKQITLNKSSVWFSRASGICLGPEGKSERNLAECLPALAPALLVDAGSGARQRGDPMQTPLPVCGGSRRDRVSLLPHFKLTLRLWPALNTADNAGFIARGWWQTGTNCQACAGSNGAKMTGVVGFMVRHVLMMGPPQSSHTRPIMCSVKGGGGGVLAPSLPHVPSEQRGLLDRAAGLDVTGFSAVSRNRRSAGFKGFSVIYSSHWEEYEVDASGLQRWRRPAAMTNTWACRRIKAHIFLWQCLKAFC